MHAEHLSSSTHRVAIVGPAGPLHLAALDVEGEVLDVHVARALVDAVGEPGDLTARRHDHVGVDDGGRVLRIGAETGGMWGLGVRHGVWQSRLVGDAK